MTTDYDAIAEQYRRTKRQPWRAHVEAFTLVEMLGDLGGLRVLDLACGEGHSTRLLPPLGASRVVGVDRSGAMIALARAEEAARPLGIEYHVRDGREPGLPPEFDVVTAAYLLNYAGSREDLAAMAAGAARCLAPGGRFVTINANPDLPFDRGASYRKYGFEVRALGDRREGMPYTWSFATDGDTVEVENYWLPASAYEEALRAAGFAQVRWRRPTVSPAGISAFGAGYWDDLLEHPPVIGIECLA